jgi:hypothetical protein
MCETSEDRNPLEEASVKEHHDFEEFLLTYKALAGHGRR